ncbi:MAG: CpaF family protein [Chloroflexi bacterium]|nr:CpaF family protein [Chloroflexota bacterium]
MSNRALLNRVRAERVAVPALSGQAQDELTEAVRVAVTGEFLPEEILAPDEATRGRIRERIRFHVSEGAEQAGLGLSAAQENAVALQVERVLLGWGFLEEFLPPARDDLTEIALCPDGVLYLKVKGDARFRRVEGFDPPSPGEVRRVIQAILGPLGRRATEAEPIVSARLPRTERMPAGARVHVVLPPIVNGRGYPALNVRLFEESPITPERLLSWGALNEEMMGFLRQVIGARCSVLIAGGTGTGKTTLLNMVSEFIPRDDRVVSIEDTQELRLNVPHWVAMETRAPSIEGKYGVGALDLVNAALRMTPDWIIVGEVRAGDVAAGLLQTQISGHAGLSTIHARSPWEAVQTLILRCLQSGQFPKVEAIKVLIALAVDVMVQLEWDATGVRRVSRIAQVERDLKGGDVRLTDLFRWNPHAGEPTWERIGEYTRG